MLKVLEVDVQMLEVVDVQMLEVLEVDHLV